MPLVSVKPQAESCDNSDVTERDLPAGATARRWAVVLLALNFVGAVVYVRTASHGWVRPGESVSGEPFIWFASVLPVCVVFFVLNLTWGAFVLARKQWRIGIFWLVLIPIWLVAVAIDFAHH